MPKLTWDDAGQKLYETGVSKGVLYLQDATGAYPTGVSWNGLISVTESPSGGEPTALYADNVKYLELMSAEEFGASVEAYMYPDEFAQCDGTAELSVGVTIGQQERASFGLVYVTELGNDTQGNDHGYKIHIVYGAKAKPSEKAYKSINDSPEAITFSWDLTTTPVNVTGHKPTATLVIDSTKIGATDLAAIEDKLFGSATAGATLPLPDDILALINATV